jgi:hypothetical protein
MSEASALPGLTAKPGRPRRKWQLILLALMVLIVLPAVMVVCWIFYARHQATRVLEDAIAETDRLDSNWRLEDIERERTTLPPEQNAAVHNCHHPQQHRVKDLKHDSHGTPADELQDLVATKESKGVGGLRGFQQLKVVIKNLCGTERRCTGWNGNFFRGSVATYVKFGLPHVPNWRSIDPFFEAPSSNGQAGGSIDWQPVGLFRNSDGSF